MKRLIYAVVFLAAIFTGQAQEPDWGVPDTLEHYSLGSGIGYTKIAYQKKPVVIWLTTIDLTDPTTQIKQVQSHDKVPDVPRETVMSMSKRYTTTNHRVCAAFNHDFFSYDQGICIGLNITNGEIPYGNGWGRSLLAVSADRVAGVFFPNLEGRAILTDGSQPKIEYYNSSADYMPGDCFLFNHLNSRTLTDEGLYIQLKPLDKWLVNGANIPCEVMAISTAPLQTSSTLAVIYARNSRIADFEGKVQVGDRIHISQKFIQTRFGTPLNNIVAGFHGYPSIAFEGKLHDGEYNDFENGREYEVSARVMAGTSQDGTKFYVAVVEGGTPQSPGVNCVDLANWMLAHGAWNVVNFDSGGSATIAVDHTMLNYPMRGSVRPVTDALLVVSTAPESSEVDYYSFITPSLYTSSVSLNPLTLLSFNVSDKVLEKGVQGFTYQCIPNDLGYVDEDGVFHASTQSGNGKIIATKDGKQAILNVYVSPVSNVHLITEELLIDGNRSYPIEIVATSGTQTFALDAGAFNWTSSNATCCVVENGIVRGLSDGESVLEGVLDGLKLTLSVTVEIASGHKVHETFNDLSTWPLTTTGTFTNIRFVNNDLPFGWDDGINMLFDVNTGRSASVAFTKPVRFYSLPDSISFQLSIKDDLIKEAYLDFSSRAESSYLKVKIEPSNGKDSVYVISFSDNANQALITDYPITMTSLKLYCKTGMQYTDSRLSFRDLKAYYPGDVFVGINDFTKDDDFCKLVIEGDEAVIYYDLVKTGQARIDICNAQGINVLNYVSNRLLPGRYEYRIPLYRLQKDLYIANIRVNGNATIIKFQVNK